MLRAWPLAEQIAFFERELGLRSSKKETAKLFPASNRARDVRDGLLALAARRGAPVSAGYNGHRTLPLRMAGASSGSGPGDFEADAVIVATGGLSVPNTGSDGRGLAILAALGHTVHPTYPALTPLTAEPAPSPASAGISLPVTVTARDDGRAAEATAAFSSPIGIQRALRARRLPRAGALPRWKAMSAARSRSVDQCSTRRGGKPRLARKAPARWPAPYAASCPTVSPTRSPQWPACPPTGRLHSCGGRSGYG